MVAAGPDLAEQAKVIGAVLGVEDNAEQRINFSGKLKMLSQRIPAAACHLTQGIDPEGASKLIVAAPAEFEKILSALEFGDDELNTVHPEDRRMTLHKLHELRQKWEPMKAAASKIADATANDDVSYVLTHNMVVLGGAQSLVSELVQQYSNPNAVTFAGLLLVDISGRQRVLTQKIAKESCIMTTVYESEETANDLQGTMSIFEASLEALRFGLSDLGIKTPPSTSISEGLETVVADWSSVKPYITNVIAGGELDAPEAVTKFQGLNTTMANMNNAVGMYAAATKPVQ